MQVTGLCTIGTGIQSAIPNSQSAITIAPNPFSENVEFRIKNEELGMKNLELKIYDLLGREVRKLQITDSKFQIDGKDFSSGIYFYQVTNNKQPIARGKIVKQ